MIAKVGQYTVYDRMSIGCNIALDSEENVVNALRGEQLLPGAAALGGEVFHRVRLQTRP